MQQKYEWMIYSIMKYELQLGKYDSNLTISYEMILIIFILIMKLISINLIRIDIIISWYSIDRYPECLLNKYNSFCYVIVYSIYCRKVRLWLQWAQRDRPESNTRFEITAIQIHFNKISRSIFITLVYILSYFSIYPPALFEHLS